MRRLAVLATALALVVPAPADAHRTSRKAEYVERSEARRVPKARASRSARGIEPTPALLDCIAEWESERGTPYRTGYGAVSPSGKYRGRYQFDARTFRGVAERIGHHRWARTPVDQVPPDVQDAAAGQLLRERGLQPWPTPAKRCRAVR